MFKLGYYKKQNSFFETGRIVNFSKQEELLIFRNRKALSI